MGERSHSANRRPPGPVKVARNRFRDGVDAVPARVAGYRNSALPALLGARGADQRESR
ncbi:hypothetical protein GCM10010492_70660 [Saccharothrix mutabilis subsp. mutabilis]|uniref:Uncharacterized protein n=1 Tax=Saccharothrix mutabilis subsp. mutabilis TaxID=66855 RepID=A0ABN0URY3_9PSEU